MLRLGRSQYTYIHTYIHTYILLRIVILLIYLPASGYSGNYHGISAAGHRDRLLRVMELLHARRNRSAGTFTTSSLCCCCSKLCATRRASDAGEHFEAADVALHHGAVHIQTRCPARGSSSRTPRRCNVRLRRPRPPSWLGRHHRRLPGHFCRSGGPTLRLLLVTSLYGCGRRWTCRKYSLRRNRTV